MHLDSVESAGGRLGAVLSAPRSGVVALAARAVARHDADARRGPDRAGPLRLPRRRHPQRRPVREHRRHPLGPRRLRPADPRPGRPRVSAFEREWHAALDTHDRTRPAEPYDAMVLLRRPSGALDDRRGAGRGRGTRDRRRRPRPRLDRLPRPRHLGPPTARPLEPRSPHREGRPPRPRGRAVARSPGPPAPRRRWRRCSPPASRSRSPPARGCWPGSPAHPATDDPVHAVWETLRLTPPTWITARITTEDVELAGTEVPAGRVVLVSPLLLGRRPGWCRATRTGLAEFDPDRWQPTPPAGRAPGCPSAPDRTRAPAARSAWPSSSTSRPWAGRHTLTLSESVCIDQSRGIAPLPCRFTASPKGDPRDRAPRPAGHPVTGRSPPAARLATRVILEELGARRGHDRTAAHFLS